MQYYANPNEMLAVVRERHEELLRAAELSRRVHLSRPPTPPFTTRFTAQVQSMVRAGKARWQQARMRIKLAPAK